jgi:hypothetical protein
MILKQRRKIMILRVGRLYKYITNDGNSTSFYIFTTKNRNKDIVTAMVLSTGNIINFRKKRGIYTFKEVKQIRL